MDKRAMDWQARAAQNLRAAILLICRTPPLPLAAVSRLYYASFQAAHFALLQSGHGSDAKLDHGELWRAADSLRPGLGGDLQDLHSWRRKADYAVGMVPDQVARDLVAKFTTITRALGVTEAP